MLPRECFINALERRKPFPGRVPHFELVFFLTMEVFGKIHPHHRNYHQWDQMEEKERQLHRIDMADTYIKTAERFEHSAILILPIPNLDTVEDNIKMLDIIREKSGDKYFLLLARDATYGIPSGENMLSFSYRISDDLKGLKKEAEQEVNKKLEQAECILKHGGLDGFIMGADYCFNYGPFLSPAMFSELVTPYLTKLTKGYRDMGFYTIKHTDGNITPIIDQLIEANPHALHSLDPQAGIDIAEIKKKYGNKICLIGNVNCGLMDTGSDEEVTDSARYALKHGMPGGGYIFSTSNCIYTGMKLSRYELMLDIWRKEGNYTNLKSDE